MKWNLILDKVRTKKQKENENEWKRKWIMNQRKKVLN